MGGQKITEEKSEHSEVQARIDPVLRAIVFGSKYKIYIPGSVYIGDLGLRRRKKKE
jgi:hypothetical protein